MSLARLMSAKDAGMPAGSDTVLCPTDLACMFTVLLNAVKVKNEWLGAHSSQASWSPWSRLKTGQSTYVPARVLSGDNGMSSHHAVMRGTWAQ